MCSCTGFLGENRVRARFFGRRYTQLLQQANKHQLLNQNQLNMVGSEMGCMFCIHRIQCTHTHALVYTHMWKFSMYAATPISPNPFRGVAKKLLIPFLDKNGPCTVHEHCLLSLGVFIKKPVHEHILCNRMPDNTLQPASLCPITWDGIDKSESRVCNGSRGKNSACRRLPPCKNRMTQAFRCRVHFWTQTYHSPFICFHATLNTILGQSESPPLTLFRT